MAHPQLKLIAPSVVTWQPQATDPARRIFEHWLYLFGRLPSRCKLGPTRRAAIAAALAMGYDEDMLCQAIEGMAADPLERASGEHVRQRMRELEWLMGAESRIEHWAERGQMLRDGLHAAPPALVVSQPAPPSPADAAAAQAARERLRQRAAELRGAHG